MFLTRGDAHKFYKKIKKARLREKTLKNVKEIEEINEIQSFYLKLETDDLIKIQYQMEKEKTGSGMLPLLVSSLPWLLFIFSNQLQDYLLKDDSLFLLWGFIMTYVTVITFSISIHFREKAWATIHIKILKDIIHSRKANNIIKNHFNFLP